LIEREPEVAALRGLLLPGECRLVTLTGPGGVGKTRPALGVADSLAGCFADGVEFVDLAPVREPALVAAGVATALGIREGEHKRTVPRPGIRDRDNQAPSRHEFGPGAGGAPREVSGQGDIFAGVSLRWSS
jgi:hypothetical protein